MHIKVPGRWCNFTTFRSIWIKGVRNGPGYCRPYTNRFHTEGTSQCIKRLGQLTWTRLLTKSPPIWGSVTPRYLTEACGLTPPITDASLCGVTHGTGTSPTTWSYTPTRGGHLTNSDLKISDFVLHKAIFLVAVPEVRMAAPRSSYYKNSTVLWST